MSYKLVTESNKYSTYKQQRSLAHINVLAVAIISFCFITNFSLKLEEQYHLKEYLNLLKGDVYYSGVQEKQVIDYFENQFDQIFSKK